MQNKIEKPFAGFLVRFFAYITDMFIVGILLFGFKIPAIIQSFSNPNGFFVRDVFQCAKRFKKLVLLIQ